MSTLLLRIALLLVVFLVSPACKGGDDCDGSCEIDAGDDGGKVCASSSECSGGTPACDVTGSGTCVQCTVAESAACSGSTPVCGDNELCRGCRQHAECLTSNACIPGGACAAPAQVAYVQAGGSGTECTQALPCGTLDDGIKAGRPYVKVAAGLVKDTKTTTIDGKVVTIIADLGAKIDRDGTGPVLDIRSEGTAVTIYDLEITGADNPGGDGIQMFPNGGLPSLLLIRVLVSGNQGRGVEVLGGSLTVSQSTFTGNSGGGISMNAIGSVTITNNFIHHNGNAITSSFGGLALRPSGSSQIELNTIVDNAANIGAASAGGVFCDDATFIAPNNIIFRNVGGAAGDIQTFGNCTYGNSIRMPGGSPTDNSLQFVNPNSPPYDYHLSAASPPTVLDAAGACTGVDFDGQLRPSGGACNLGADELLR